MDARKIVIKIISISSSILIALLLAAGLYHCGKTAYNFGYRVFTETAIDKEGEGKDKVVHVSSKMDAREIGEMLERKGLIRSANLFVLQLKLSAYSKKIKSGIYTLSTSMTAHEMIQVMAAAVPEDIDTEEQGNYDR